MIVRHLAMIGGAVKSPETPRNAETQIKLGILCFNMMVDG